MNLFKKGVYALLFVSLLMACEKEDEPVVITGLTITPAASGDGTVVSVTPSSTGGTAYSVDFGTDATDDVLDTNGPAVEYDYPNEDKTYTITVTASADGADDVSATKEIEVIYSLPKTGIEGKWVIYHDENSLYLSSEDGSDWWWSNPLTDLLTKDCYFNDTYEFKEDGTFVNTLGEKTWTETWQGKDADGCTEPVAPHDGTATATYFHDTEAKTIKISGKAAFLGLAKVYNGALLTSLDDEIPETITYSEVTLSEDKNTLEVEITYDADGEGNIGRWKFKFAREGSEGASIPQRDTDADGVIDLYDACPDKAGTEATNGCPAPENVATEPTRTAANVISLFSGAYTDVTVNTWRTDWSSGAYESVTIVAADDVKFYKDLGFVGIELGAGNLIDLATPTMTHVHIDVWTPNANTFTFKLVDFGPNGVWEANGDNTEHEIKKTGLTSGEWISYDIPLSEFTGLTTKSNIAQLVFAATGGAGIQTNIYIDNLYFYKE